ncbi:bacillithiol biosynthesis deacetylase BshB1 [Botrimarina sp.]|uniref:bacillithiol biosynthesis deacetylase BshB1 n=1 Tax=Botrimarina sp. TaxID=2795802 RepID=UPI0032EB5797
MLDVLVVAPHPDDAELGVAGTILKLQQQGKRVGVLDLTSGEPTPHGSVETRQRETAAATQVLGLAWREHLGLPNRSLEASLANRALVAEVIRRTRPQWLFAPYWDDAHPDHTAATRLVEEARFWAKLTKTDQLGQAPLAGEPHHPSRVFYYYCVHLKLAPQPAFVVDISDVWEQKAASIACYQSQFVTGRPTAPPMFLDRVRDEAAYWGKAIGTAYGEPIASREPLGLGRLDGLV